MKGLVTRLQQAKAAKLGLVAALSLSSSLAMASTASTEFNALATRLENWSEGSLGLALAIAAFIIGLAVGLMKQTILPALVGIGVALAATLGPDIIRSMFTAVI